MNIIKISVMRTKNTFKILNCECAYHIEFIRSLLSGYPMLGKCWHSVVDGGSTLAQHWAGVSYDLPMLEISRLLPAYRLHMAIL